MAYIMIDYFNYIIINSYCINVFHLCILYFYQTVRIIKKKYSFPKYNLLLTVVIEISITGNSILHNNSSST